MMKNVYLLCSIWICSIGILAANEASRSYYSTQAKTGDGVYSILRRYQLLNECNLGHFYEINNLSSSNPLLKGKDYKLPVYIYRYNGKSIRSTIDIDDMDKALRIKAYNEKLRKEGLRKMSIESSNILWVPYHEIFCMAERVNMTSTTKESANIKDYPIFGPKYRHVKVTDQKLKGHVYYVVSGHGGPDPGCDIRLNGHYLAEDEFAYDVSLRLARNLIAHGAMVELIVQDQNDGIRDERYLKHDQDERCNGAKLPLNQKRRLAQRTDYINRLSQKYKKQGLHNQKVISIHVDSHLDRHQQIDVHFLYSRGSDKGRRIATNLMNTFRSKYARYQKDRGYRGKIKESGLYVVKNTAPPAVLVELGNMQNMKDHKRILSPANRQHLANWLYEGIIK